MPARPARDVPARPWRTVGIVLAVFVAVALTPRRAAAANPTVPIVLFRLEPLGLDAERALRLEALFRLELERLAGVPLPGRPVIEAAIAREPALRGCSGGTECVAAVGKKLGAQRIVAGNVGELGDSFIVNLKLVDVATRAELRRVSEPLRGDPDELIEAVRVAAYRLVAPEQLEGALAILSDVPGAEVFLDGKVMGRTPLAGPIGGLSVGKHALHLRRPGYSDFRRDVEIRFQKTSEVVVRMVAAAPGRGPLPRPADRPAPRPASWWSSGWGYATVGAGAVVVGVLVGLVLADGPQVVPCDRQPDRCAP